MVSSAEGSPTRKKKMRKLRVVRRRGREEGNVGVIAFEQEKNIPNGEGWARVSTFALGMM